MRMPLDLSGLDRECNEVFIGHVGKVLVAISVLIKATTNW